MSTTKRPAPRTPDGPPPKRRATSSPEEGELDDGNGLSPVPCPSVATPSCDARPKFKVPFPFRNKNTLLSRIEDAPPTIAERRDYIRETHRGRVHERQETSHHRPPAIYDRYEGDGQRSYQENAAYTRDRRLRVGGAGRRSAAGDHYEPSYPNNDFGAFYLSRSHSRDDVCDRRPKEHEIQCSPQRRESSALINLASRTGVRSNSTRSVSRDRSRSPSTSPQDAGRKKRKHRLPTPRSAPLTMSPPYDDHVYDRNGDKGDHYAPYDEPYRRDTYRDRGRDPRGHYHREELDDYDRFYRPGNSRGYHREQSFLHRSRTPFRPTTPPRPADPISSTILPSPPLPPSAQHDSNGDMYENKADEILQVHEAVSFALRRPGAPRNECSPPSFDVQIKKSTPVPPVMIPTEELCVETPAPVAAKSKRATIKRTREQEKDAYQRIFTGCGNRDDYDVMTKLGEGTFGEVHKALHKQSGVVVALKRILMHNEKEGMPVTALREIKILKALGHPCVVDLLDMFIIQSKGKESPMSVYMVFPYMDHDLAGLLENERVKLSPSQIKLYMKQLLEGTEYMHHNNIVHRDMKAANLLISNSGSLKIADFGLARAFDSSEGGRDRRYTNCVVTRWYRPPELLLGARHYGGEIDIWGIGCVLGEMIMRRPILPGNSDLDQLDKIWSICGSPNQQNWPDYDKLPGCGGQIRFKPQERRIKQVYDSLGKETCELMDKLLTLDPRERITASDALDHEYFWSDPLPADPKSLPTYEASHEFYQRGRRHQQVAPHEVLNPPVRQGGPQAVQNRNFRYDDARKHVVREHGASSYTHHNASFNQLPGPLPQPPMALHHHLPMPPSQNFWSSGVARDGTSWGAGISFGPMSTINGDIGVQTQQVSLLPPRPPGLPPRPEGLPLLPNRRAGNRFGDQSNPFKVTPGNGGLNYG